MFASRIQSAAIRSTHKTAKRLSLGTERERTQQARPLSQGPRPKIYDSHTETAPPLRSCAAVDGRTSQRPCGRNSETLALDDTCRCRSGRDHRVEKIVPRSIQFTTTNHEANTQRSVLASGTCMRGTTRLHTTCAAQERKGRTHMQFKRAITIAVTLAISTPITLFAAAPQTAGMIPGLWEITLQTTSPVAAPPSTYTICVDRALELRADPPKGKAKNDCQVSFDPAATNETAFTVRCTKGKTSSSSRITYLGDHFTGTIVMVSASGAETHQDYKGTRIGDCDETQPAPPLPPAPQTPPTPAPVQPPAH